MSDKPVEIHIVCEVWTLNAERRLHWGRRGELTKQARWAAKIEAMRMKVPPMEGKVNIRAVPMQARGPLADPGAHFPVVKAVIDGLRDARVLTDDTQKYVSANDMDPPIKTKAGATGIILYLTPEPPHL